MKQGRTAARVSLRQERAHDEDRVQSHELEALARGDRNQATNAVARKLVALLLALDKRGTDYEARAVEAAA